MQKILIPSIIGFSMLLFSMSGTIVAVAFPQIISTFKTSIVGAGWVMSIYQIMATITMPLAGRASDIYGSKLVLMICFFLFIIGSLFCALAPDIVILIIFRFIQAIAYGGMFPCAVSIAVEQVPEYRRQIVGLLPTIGAVGQIIGPNLGGWLIEVFGWRSIFWMNVPLILIVSILAQILFRGSKKEGGTLDLGGALILTGVLSSFLLALTMLGDKTEKSWLMIGGLFTAFAGFLMAFIKYEAKVSKPILDLQVFRHKPFIAINLYNLVTGACNFGISSFIPFYMVSLYGASTILSGAILTPKSLLIIITASITSVFLSKWGYRRPIIVGTVCVFVTLIILGIQPQDVMLGTIQISSIVFIIIGMALAGFFGVSTPAINNAFVEMMPDRVATIMGIRGMFYQCGGAISIAIISIILNIFSDNLSQGFAVVYFGLAALLLFIFPAIPLISGVEKVKVNK